MGSSGIDSWEVLSTMLGSISPLSSETLSIFPFFAVLYLCFNFLVFTSRTGSINFGAHMGNSDFFAALMQQILYVGHFFWEEICLKKSQGRFLTKHKMYQKTWKQFLKDNKVVCINFFLWFGVVSTLRAFVIRLNLKGGKNKEEIWFIFRNFRFIFKQCCHLICRD